VFQKDYAKAFGGAEGVFIMKPYDQSKIQVSDQFSSEELVDDLNAQNSHGYLMTEVDSGVTEVTKFCRPGDVVIVLSNGGFGGFIPKLIEALKSK
jgi:UDP-N-acetylmuramate: L-alanyl-gamma-D-glutamyl-meso-diaminopimelate ligase